MSRDDRSNGQRGGQRRRGSRQPSQGASRPASGRRTPPPDNTGEETKFLEGLCKSESTVTVHLSGGQTIEGLIERFAPGIIEVGTGDGNTVVLRKSDIRYIIDP